MRTRRAECQATLKRVTATTARGLEYGTDVVELQQMQNVVDEGSRADQIRACEVVGGDESPRRPNSIMVTCKARAKPGPGFFASRNLGAKPHALAILNTAAATKPTHHHPLDNSIPPPNMTKVDQGTSKKSSLLVRRLTSHQASPPRGASLAKPTSVPARPSVARS